MNRESHDMHVSANATPLAAGQNPATTENAAFRRPDLGGAEPDPFMALPAPGANNRTVLIAAGVVGAGLLVCALGLFFGGSRSTPAAPAVPVVNALTEQQRMMREAMSMAREAQDMNRERIELLRASMENEMAGPGAMRDESSGARGGENE
jgi:hypothetical protein